MMRWSEIVQAVLLCAVAISVVAARGIADQWPLTLENRFIRVEVQEDLSFSVHYLDSKPGWHTRNAVKQDWYIAGKPVDIKDVRTRWRWRFHDGLHEGYILSFEGFSEEGIPDDASITVFLGLAEDTPELGITIFPGEGAGHLTEARYPYPIVSESTEKGAVVLPLYHGVLIPDDYPDPSSRNTLIWASHVNMPFFAGMYGKATYLAICQTPHDTSINYEHVANKPTTVCFHSRSSMGSLTYPRQFLVRFLGDVGYVGLAKEYRKYSRSIGRLVTLKEKAAKLPKIAQLIRSFQFEAMPYEISEDDVRPQRVVRDYDARLADTAEILKRVPGPIDYYASGWKFILPGGTQITPPGGWQALKRFVDGLHEMGCLVQLYENHHLMTTDSPYYTPGIAVKDANGKERAWRESWGGGAPAKDVRALAPAVAPGFVRLKYEGLIKKGIHPDAVYQDQFGAVTLYENYDPLLRNDRRQCQKYWAEALDVTSELGMITGTEIGYDWTIPHVAFYAWMWPVGRKAGNVCTLGIRIPLWHLVYHDCALIRNPEQPARIRLLRNYLCGYYSRMGASHGKPIAWQSEVDTGVTMEDWVRLIKRQSQFLAQVAMSEMTSHQFLDDSQDVQRTEFANGIAVEANFKKLTVRILGAKGFDEAWHPVTELKVPD